MIVYDYKWRLALNATKCLADRSGLYLLELARQQTARRGTSAWLLELDS
jgi:hypothetical protein